MTEENERKRYIGWKDSPLSIKGIKQLQTFMQEKQYDKAELIITSDLQRTVETASVLFPLQHWRNMKEFREYHFGDWDGKSYEMLKDDKRYQRWLNNPVEVTPPNGESYDLFKARVLAGWEQLLSHFDNEQIRHIVLIAHGGPIRILLEQFAPEERSFWEWSINYGCGYQLIGNREKMRRKHRCISLREVPFTERKSGYMPFTN